MWDSLKSWMCGLECYKQNCMGNVGEAGRLEYNRKVHSKARTKSHEFKWEQTVLVTRLDIYLLLVSLQFWLRQNGKAMGFLWREFFRKQPLVRGMVIFSCFQPGFQWELGIKGRAGGCEKHSVWQENECVKRGASRSQLSKRLVIVKRSWAVYTGTVGERALKAVHGGARQNSIMLARPTPEPHSSSLSCTSIDPHNYDPQRYMESTVGTMVWISTPQIYVSEIYPQINGNGISGWNF